MGQHERAQLTTPFLFMRIVPILKDIGLWGPKIPEAFTDMGVIAWADTDIDAAMAEDEQVAEQIDREQDARLRHVQAVANTIAACGYVGRSGPA